MAEHASRTEANETKRVTEGRESVLARIILAPLYNSTTRLAIRRLAKSLIVAVEGGEGYSRTIRRLMLKHYDREVGYYSGGAALEPTAFSAGPPRIRIGRYTSLAQSMRAFNHDHPVAFKSTHAFFYDPKAGFANKDYLERTALEIGSDVWIGHNAILLRKVGRVGHGAVIAAGAVVNQDVPPYAIMAGYPARVVRYRFSPGIIDELLASEWWLRPMSELAGRLAEFQRPLEQAAPAARYQPGAAGSATSW